MKYISQRMLLSSLMLCLSSTPTFAAIQQNFAKLEAATGGKLGLSAIDTNTNQRIEYHGDKRFPMGCTAKVIGVAAVLQKSMTDQELLSEKIIIQKSDLTNWNPITEKNVSKSMTISQLCAAAISYSDNTAMNLLLKKLGGPENVNIFARSLGDNVFKLDHLSPEEANANPTCPDDSTTPNAMLTSLQKITLGNVLAAPQREMLLSWLKKTVTGNARIRAGVPKNWMVGDKTGSGSHYGTTNDVAIIWPPKCAPILVTMYYSNNKKDAPKRTDVLASATKNLIAEFAKTDPCVKQALMSDKSHA